MTFLTDEALASAISTIAGEDDAMCCVAFWGRGAAQLLSKGSQARLICNLAAGGTNPYEIEKLDRDRVRQLDDLHAKVYIGADTAVVASANASSNGLGLEGSEQARWLEAGWIVTDVLPLKAWFEDLWDGCARVITDGDLGRAKLAWSRRQRAKPSLSDFVDFDPGAADFPLVSWIHPDTPVSWHKAWIEKQRGGTVIDEAFQERLDMGLGIDSPEDRPLFADGRWVFVFTRRKSDGLPSRSRRPYWTFLMGCIPRAATVDGERIDWAPRAENVPPEPFSITPRLVDAFSEAIARRRFEILRRADYPIPYFEPHQELMRKLWWETCDLYGAR